MVWVAPTYRKAKIGYRYMKAMMPDMPGYIDCINGKLEIRIGNGTTVVFLHGKDAEVTIEGEGVDDFVIDEAGKIDKQVWYSLLTTITQTQGKGIVTGTPRGVTWYKDVFKRAKSGDSFFCWAQVKTEDSPFITTAAVARAKRLLPKFLYEQYFNASFISEGSTFGDLSMMWDENLKVIEPCKFWLHPDVEERNLDVFHGIDIGKKEDFTVFYSINQNGNLVGFARFRHVPYPMIITRIKVYLEKHFHGDNIIRFDATGVGEAFGDHLVEAELDASITPVTFTNKSKSEMVTKTIMAIQAGWHRSPRIKCIEDEFVNYELEVTASGLYRYSAPDGEHDDIVSAALLSISAAYSSSQSEKAEKILEEVLSGRGFDSEKDDAIDAYAALASDDTFFDGEVDEQMDDDDWRTD